jgi:hypothetical protein
LPGNTLLRVCDGFLITAHEVARQQAKAKNFLTQSHQQLASHELKSSVMNDILEAESTVFPASRAANTEFGMLIRLTTVTLGLDAAIMLFTRLRSRASQLRSCPWPPTPSDLAPVFLSFIELLGLAVESAPRCANCHDTEHSTATCPHFPASFTHDAALGYLPPPTTAGTSGSGKKGTKRQRPSRPNKSNKPAGAAVPPSGPRSCRFGVNCRNKLTTCKFTH